MAEARRCLARARLARNRRRGILAGASTVLLSTVLLLSQSSPVWYQRYQAALDKINANDCATAVTLLRLATAENPEPARSPRYTPYYYLGLCYENLGDDEAAADAYATEEAKGVIKEFPDDYKVLTRSLELIQKGEAYQLVVIDPSKKAARSGPPKEAAKTAPKPAASAGPDRLTPSSPATSASQAVPPLKAGKQATSAPVADPALTRTLVKFLNGDYQEAAREAEAFARQEGPDKSTALFVAGASHYSLFLLSGEADQQARQQADRYFQACRGYAPPTRWISPSILKYFRELAAQTR